MPSFDVVSEVDAQEVRNAVDQAQREISTRFDFKNTNSTIDQKDMVITLHTVSEDRLAALRIVLPCGTALEVASRAALPLAAELLQTLRRPC